MRLVLLSLALLAPAPAFAAGVVLMVNMNYSSQELKAAEEQAAARGQKIEVVPPREMIATVEPMFLERERLQEELVKRYPQKNPLELKSDLAGILREGSAWKGDPEVAAFVGVSRMTDLAAKAAKVAAMEKQNGDIFDQLKKKAAGLKARGDRVDSLILSSHSDGSNLTGETSNRLSANDIARLKTEEPELFDSARHVLLLGCYGMTKPHHQTWRYEMFPHASLLAGFGLKAPSRFDDTSANFIRQVMGKAQELDRKLADGGQPLDPAYLDQELNSLDSFNTTAHPGVIDYCYSIIQGHLPGKPPADDFNKPCDDQWKDLYTYKEKMRDYWSLTNPREDPPTESGGALRDFYNTLQLACPPREAKSQASDWRNSERMRTSLREQVIRLIFWWNVQQNFGTYYQTKLQSMNARAVAAGAYPMPKLDGTLSRVGFIRAYHTVDDKLREKSPALAAEFEKLWEPLYKLQGEDTVGEGQKLTIEDTLARGAIPFNWIEGTTVLRGPG